MQSIKRYFEEHQQEMLDCLEEMVNIESPTTDPEAVNRLGAYIRDQLHRIGATTVIDEQETRGNHIIADFASDKPGDPILMIGHMDTVWRIGTLEDMPFQISDGKAYGPGVVDMKTGLVLMLYLLRCVEALDLEFPRPVKMIFNSDEEMRSEYSRDLIMDTARNCHCALIFEPSKKLEHFTIEKKGSGNLRLTTHGRASHSGSAIEQGVNAIEEMSHQVLRLQRMTDLEVGTTVSVGTIEGGERVNVVPDRVEIGINVRAPNTDEMKKVLNNIYGLEPVLAGASLTPEGDFHRPPVQPSEETYRLFNLLQSVGSDFGVDVTTPPEIPGGTSDGNLTASAGCPTIEGFGGVGDGAHSSGEHSNVDAMTLRAAMATAFVLKL